MHTLTQRREVPLTQQGRDKGGGTGLRLVPLLFQVDLIEQRGRDGPLLLLALCVEEQWSVFSPEVNVTFFSGCFPASESARQTKKVVKNFVVELGIRGSSLTCILCYSFWIRSQKILHKVFVPNRMKMESFTKHLLHRHTRRHTLWGFTIGSTLWRWVVMTAAAQATTPLFLLCLMVTVLLLRGVFHPGITCELSGMAV